MGSEFRTDFFGAFDVASPRFTRAEASEFERTMFNMTCSNLGIGLPLLPWEQGVFAQIFAPEVSNGLPDTLNVAPAPAPLATAEPDEEKAEVAEDGAVAGVPILPLFAKHVRALCDREPKA